MKIAFADFGAFKYTIETPYGAPLGGIESSVCYLAEELAASGHEVYVLNALAMPVESRGVHCIPREQVPAVLLPSMDAVIVVNSGIGGSILKQHVRDDTPIILWSGHAHDERAMQSLLNPLYRDAYDGFVLVSDWQSDMFGQTFGIEDGKRKVIPYGFAPAFEGLFEPGKPILSYKHSTPVLAYTSTPYRGLKLLLALFPYIRMAMPGTTLKVFSSMKVYQIDADKDELEFGDLYRRCRETEGVEHVGSLPQPELATEMRSVTALAYSNTFPETCCINLMEALASGCIAITSELGALPQTGAGFANIVPVNGDWSEYAKRYISQVVHSLQLQTSGDFALVGRNLAAQVAFFNQNCTWAVRAGEWTEYIDRLAVSSGRPSTATSLG